MVAIAVVGYTHSTDLENQADTLSTLDLQLLTLIMTSCGAATILVSLIGLLGAWFQNPNALKLVLSHSRKTVLFMLVFLLCGSA